MQLEMAHFAPTTWQTGQNIHIVFDSGPFAPLFKNTTSPIKLEGRNIYRKCGRVVFDIC